VHGVAKPRTGEDGWERRRFGVGMREIRGALAWLCVRKLADGPSETAVVVRASVSVRE